MGDGGVYAISINVKVSEVGAAMARTYLRVASDVRA